MALEETVTQLRKKALAQRRPPTPDAYQGVTKERIAEVLRAIDRYTVDRGDTVFALLDDEHDSWFSSAPKGAKFNEGASTAHIACHVGILQRGEVQRVQRGRYQMALT